MIVYSNAGPGVPVEFSIADGSRPVADMLAIAVEEKILPEGMRQDMSMQNLLDEVRLRLDTRQGEGLQRASFVNFYQLSRFCHALIQRLDNVPRYKDREAIESFLLERHAHFLKRLSTHVLELIGAMNPLCQLADSLKQEGLQDSWKVQFIDVVSFAREGSGCSQRERFWNWLMSLTSDSMAADLKGFLLYKAIQHLGKIPANERWECFDVVANKIPRFGLSPGLQVKLWRELANAIAKLPFKEQPEARGICLNGMVSVAEAAPHDRRVGDGLPQALGNLPDLPRRNNQSKYLRTLEDAAARLVQIGYHDPGLTLIVHSINQITATLMRPNSAGFIKELNKLLASVAWICKLDAPRFAMLYGAIQHAVRTALLQPEVDERRLWLSSFAEVVDRAHDLGLPISRVMQVRVGYAFHAPFSPATHAQLGELPNALLSLLRIQDRGQRTQHIERFFQICQSRFPDGRTPDSAKGPDQILLKVLVQFQQGDFQLSSGTLEELRALSTLPLIAVPRIAERDEEGSLEEVEEEEAEGQEEPAGSNGLGTEVPGQNEGHAVWNDFLSRKRWRSHSHEGADSEG